MKPVPTEVRSRMMAAIHGYDTLPERTFRRLLHKRDFRFCICDRKLPGSPDIKMSRYKIVIFINGCFWHGHECRYFRMPKNNGAYWHNKIEKNRDRDQRVIAELMDLGWRVCVIWECAIKNKAKIYKPDIIIDKFVNWLHDDKKYFELGEANIVISDNAVKQDQDI